jgi:hypothetical protein
MTTDHGQAKLKESTFFLARYVPDLVRDEVLNIGVFVHSPGQKYFGCLFTDDFRRVKSFHPHADLELLRELQQHFEEEIELHSENWEEFIRSLQEYSNLIQFTEPRACHLRDPATEIQELFARYVGGRISGPLPLNTRLRIKQKLTAAFVRAGVWERLDKRIRASAWTHPGDTFTFDYGYRSSQAGRQPNGHIKFVHALSQKSDARLAKELAYTLDRVRRKEPAELAAVVEDVPESDLEAAHTRSILEEGGISIRLLSRLDDYVQSVRSEIERLSD